MRTKKLKNKKAPFSVKYVTYDKKLDSFRVRVPGTGQVLRKTIESAIKERDRRISLIKSGKIKIDFNITFKQWFEIWLEKYCSTPNQHTKEGYEDDINRSCESLFNLKMLEIKPYHINDLLQSMAHKDIAYSTIRRTRAVLSSIFRSIRDNGFIEYDRLPTYGVKLPPKTATKHKSVPRRAFDIETLDKLTEAAKTFSKNKESCQLYTTALLVLTRTGMRCSELLGLCREDISITKADEMTISITRSVHTVKKKKNVEGLTWIIGPTKSENGNRTIFIKDNDCVTQMRYLLTLDIVPIMYDEQEYHFIFRTNTGRPISKSNFTRSFVKIRKKTDSDIKIHEIRHSIATLMASNPTISYNNAAAFLGHSLNVFMKYYVHPSERNFSSCSLAISSAFKKV